MPEKKQPLGICDLCLKPIPPEDWLTHHGQPRLHCSLECRQSANASSPLRDNDPLVDQALKKLRHGLAKDLSPDEHKAYSAYRKRLAEPRTEQIRAYHRRLYHQQMRTPEGQARRRNAWQRHRQHLIQQEPNHRLIQARHAAGFSQRQLAQLVGLSDTTIANWECYGVRPRLAAIRRQIEALLGPVWDQDEADVQP